MNHATGKNDQMVVCAKIAQRPPLETRGLTQGPYHLVKRQGTQPSLI